MRIEIGESLFLSLFRHIKRYHLLQTNWKVSSKYYINHKETFEHLMKNSSEIFKIRYGYGLYKQNCQKAIRRLPELQIITLDGDKHG